MVELSLSGIHFRPYSEGEEPTEYGPGDYTGVAGAIDLSRIKFRPYEDPGYSSLGGSGSLDGGGGGSGGGTVGGGAPPGIGEYIGFAENDESWATATFSPVSEIFVAFTLIVPSGVQAGWENVIFGSGPNQEYNGPTFFGLFNSLGEPLDGLYFSQLLTTGYWQFADYWDESLVRFGGPVVEETEYYIERKVTLVDPPTNGASEPFSFAYETYVDGELVQELTEGGYIQGWNENTISILYIGLPYGESGVGSSMRIDNVQLATGNYPSNGGSVFFDADFESGVSVPPFDSVSGSFTVV